MRQSLLLLLQLLDMMNQTLPLNMLNIQMQLIIHQCLPLLLIF